GDDAGIYPISISLGTTESQNYDFKPEDGLLTVNQRNISISAQDTSKKQGHDDPKLTYYIDEGTLFGSDIVSGELERESGEELGTYAINKGSLTINDNYIISFLPGVFRIIESSLAPSIDTESIKVLTYAGNSYQTKAFQQDSVYNVILGNRITLHIPWDYDGEDALNWSSNVENSKLINVAKGLTIWSMNIDTILDTHVKIKMVNKYDQGDSIVFEIKSLLNQPPQYSLQQAIVFDKNKQQISYRNFENDSLKLTQAQKVRFTMDLQNDDNDYINLNWLENLGISYQRQNNHLEIEWQLYSLVNTASFIIYDSFNCSDTINLVVTLKEFPTPLIGQAQKTPHLLSLNSNLVYGFSLPQDNLVRINIFNAQGKKVFTFNDILPSGSYKFSDFMKNTGANQNYFISIKNRHFKWNGTLGK
ncbi:MAG: hypothetical protein GX801_06895, partial [Fibrobacter sp.]|nr:hypothetical protein [Fibrobacter sp.]